MTMGDGQDDLVDRVHGLSDLELAMLLSLVSHEHCIIGTSEDVIDDLANELSLISQKVFKLPFVVVECYPDITLEDFATSLLLPSVPPTVPGRGSRNGATDYFHLSPVAQYSQSSHTPGPWLPRSPSGNLPTGDTVTSASADSAVSTSVSVPAMANVVIAKNLNYSPEAVQNQVLELMRTHHVFTSTAMQAAPRPFLIVAVVAAERGFFWDGSGDDDVAVRRRRNGSTAARAPHMTGHLNDSFSMGHWHDPDDGFPNIEEKRDDNDDDRETGIDGMGDDLGDGVGNDSDSVVRRSSSGRRGRSGSNGATTSTSLDTNIGFTEGLHNVPPPYFSGADIDHLSALSQDVRVDIDVLRYQMNVVAFLRIHRAMAVMSPTTSGLSCVSPIATKHFEKLAQCLAPLHRLDYVTPSLVALAARKAYLHRIRTVPVGHKGSRPATIHERSMQWGSEKAAVEVVLDGVSPEDVIEGVLGSVAPPV